MVGSTWLAGLAQIFRFYHKGNPLPQQALDQVQTLNEPQQGGMGLFLIKAYCDKVESFTDSQGLHCFSMTRKVSKTNS